MRVKHARADSSGQAETDTPCALRHDAHVGGMKKHAPLSPFAFPMMMARLTAASWETMFHRTTMMAQGTCSPAEYQRMMEEKADAMRLSMAALMLGKDQTAVMAPFVSRARANAKRLRRES